MLRLHLFNTRIPKLRRWSKNFVSRVNLRKVIKSLLQTNQENMQLGQVISNPDLEDDYSPIYNTEKPVKMLA